MNKIITYCLALLSLSAIVSCKKAFEDHPLTITTEDYIWDSTDPSGTYARVWIDKVYSQLPTGYVRINGQLLECASDDAVPSNKTNATWNVINGGYNPLSTYDDNWSNSYSAIRKVNVFLANYKKVPWADPTLPKWLSAEARVLRAYFYYDMIKRYGGVPLLGDKVFDSNDPSLFTQTRSSFDTSVKYVLSELTAVQDSLRPDQTLANRGSGNGTTEGTDNDAGRMRKSIALAIKAKMLLLAASPLYNASSTPDRDYTGYAAYDKERWKAAADAAKAVMDMNLFALEANRYTLAVTHVNKEFILMRYGASFQTTWGNLMSPVGYTVGNVVSSGTVSPTQELVDAFPMKNGKAITDPTSGYDPANPYANRDPRLDQTVFYNGATWLKRAVETFEGGKDKPNNGSINAGVQTLTGYYCKKFLGNDANNTTFTPTMYHPSVTPTFCLIRYADILLSYAEAQNEYSGPDATVYSAVEAIRQRAGLVPYALPAGLSQVQMRDVIRNERRVEFAFEEQRYYDVRRWKIAKAVYATPLHGVTIVKSTTGALSYTPVTVATPFFNDNNMYLYPILNNEVLVNPNMKQNPNY
ncbi:MAG: RagB/SusD family nutrient uptake outer membrane protein [Bacteroidota bacterium]